MVLYSCTLPKPDEGTTEVSHNITVGTHRLHFDFHWATASAEQNELITRYLKVQSQSDPLIVDNNVIVHDYDYMEYYLSLKNVNLNTWLDSNPTLPRSIHVAPRDSQLVMLRERITMCVSLEPVVQQYDEVLRWYFKMTRDNIDDITVGVIETGGWYRNQDPVLSFRFTSDLEDIKQNDLGNVTIEFEVYDV